jgi:hypothetical protein
MNFSDLGFIYLEPGNALEVSFWWGEGDNHGAVFSMARFKGTESGLLPLSDPPPFHEFTTSNYRCSVHFDLDTITDGGQDFTYPEHVYGVTVTNTGKDPSYFVLDGITSA